MDDRWTSQKRQGDVTYSVSGQPRDVFYMTAQLEGTFIKHTQSQRLEHEPTRRQVEEMFAEHFQAILKSK